MTDDTYANPYGSFLLERRPGGFQEIVGWVPRDYDVPDEGLPEGVSLVRVPGWVTVSQDGLATYTIMRARVEAEHGRGMPSESYPLGWLEAVVHWNPETGAIHTDGNREALRALIAKAEEAP